MKDPLVTITIPTLNSGKSLGFCLDSIRNQTYKNIEVNIIDGFSKDDTVSIGKKYGVKEIRFFNGALLGARYEGVKLSKGEFTLILDSDQILEPDTIRRALEMIRNEGFDMLAFEEEGVRSRTFIEKLFEMDRRLINTINDLSPLTGVIMPRFFKTKLLKDAYSNIPADMFLRTGGPDHAIVYYEAWLLSKKIAVLSHAVKHIEPSGLWQLCRKFYRWGYTSIDAHLGSYHTLMSSKERFRTGIFRWGLMKESIGSIILLILKGIPFKIGFYKAKLDEYFYNIVHSVKIQ